jgi:glutamine synthetase
MFKVFKDLQSYMAKEQINQVDLKFVDALGGWHHLSLPKDSVTADLFETGVGFDGSSVGFKKLESGDMVMVPELESAWIDPFCAYKTLSFICNVCEADTVAPFSDDPRRVVGKAAQYAKEQNIADKIIFGPEFEFHVFDGIYYSNTNGECGYRIDAAESEWNSPEAGHGYFVAREKGYHAAPPNDQFWDLRTEIVDTLQQIGVSVRYHHHEVGGTGQLEIEVPLGSMMWAADASMKIKYVVKALARKHGKTATFMPKPLRNEAGSGMHCHQTLWKGEKNLFFDESGYAGLSRTALHYIGGLLKHGRALLGLTNPSVNSYRRLIPGFEAPVKAFFSQANRSAAIRVPKYATTHDTKRIEFRPPDAMGNIYLTLAAQLMAGLDGIKNEIDPTKEGFGPIDENVFAWSAEKQDRIKSLPETMEDALEDLAKDHDFLLAGEVFTESLIDQWLKLKWKEVKSLWGCPHPLEIQMYYDA